MSDIINPLYAKKNAARREIVTSRCENSEVGVCPKCRTKFGIAELGFAGGKQKVFWCAPCHISVPVPTEMLTL